MLEFRRNPSDFTRNRVLTLEHVIGLTLSIAASRNSNGYDISSQNYFRSLSKCLDEEIAPARRTSVSEARSKLDYSAFEFLLGQANLEGEGLLGHFKFKGHVTRAIDGSRFHTPRSDDLLMHFKPLRTKSVERYTHYPFGTLVTAVNVYTGQPVAAQVDDHHVSERKLVQRMSDQFQAGDLALLDRGLGGAWVYFDFESKKQFFVHRVTTAGESITGYVRTFLDSKKKQAWIDIEGEDPESRKRFRLQVRLIRGPDDNDGQPIVFVTNLLEKQRYSRCDLLALYRKRWTVETLYDRVKNLLRLEKFHSRSYNGVMQEIFANLLILSLTALAVTAVVVEDRVNVEAELPSFKNAAESVRRHLFCVVDSRIEGIKPKKIIAQLLNEVRTVMYPIRPGRSYPRVSMQPIKSWNLKKSNKLKAFAQQQARLAAQRDGVQR